MSTPFLPLMADSLKNNLHTKTELEGICKLHANDLNFDGDRAALLMAITGCESSFGSNNVPRFEFGYSKSSMAYRRSELLQEGYKLWGDLCAMSYGAHQILWITARELGYPLQSSPLDLHSSFISIPYVIDMLNGLIKRGAMLIEEIGCCYNGGIGALKNPQAGSMKYAKILRQYYEKLCA